MNTNFDPSTQQQLEEFQRRLEAMGEFYAKAIPVLSTARMRADAAARQARYNRPPWPVRVVRRVSEVAAERLRRSDYKVDEDTSTDVIDPPYSVQDKETEDNQSQKEQA